MIKYCLFLAAILALMPYSVNEIAEFDDAPFLENVTHKLETIHVPFIKNIGQINNDNVKYYANTFAGTIYVSDSDLLYLSNPKNNTSWATKEVFVNGKISPSGQEKSLTVVNYFKGDSKNWKSNIPTYQTLSLGEVWPSIHVELKAYGNNMEKIFTVYPGANVSHIKTTFEGISKLGIDNDGQLVLDTDMGQTKFSKPIAYQVLDGKTIPVQISYKTDQNVYGFSVEKYDENLPLVIDPLIASTFIGGSGDEYSSYYMALDSSDNVYITGETDSTDYPTLGAYDPSNNGGIDAFVSKFDSSLSTLMASTFIGGSSSESSYSLVLDSSDNVYITGYTNSTDYPTLGAYDLSPNGGIDAFVSKFDSSLSTLMASTFIGGFNYDTSWDIKLDSSDNVYITGETDSIDYPTLGAYDPSNNGNIDAFVSKFDSSLSTLMASTFIGGSSIDSPYSLVLDSSDNVYITGQTFSTDYPTLGAYDPSHNGSDDAFVSKFDSSLGTLSASTFIGGSDYDYSLAMTLDSSDNVYIAGNTNSTDYPTTLGAYDPSHNGGIDAFVSKFDSSLNTLSASTFIGGSDYDYLEAIKLGSSDNVYITGETNSTAYPTTLGAYDPSHNGGDDAFVSKLDSSLGTLSASTFIGGSDYDYSLAMTLDSSDNVYITGQTFSTDYPTLGAYDPSHNGNQDVFVSTLTNDLLLYAVITSTDALSIVDSVIIVNTSTITSTDALSIVDTTQITKTSATEFISTGDVEEDGTFDVTLPENDQGSENTVLVDLPSGVAGTVTVFTTDEGASDPDISFLGTVIDIDIDSTTPSFTYSVQIAFTDADLAASNLTLDQVAIYHDDDNSGTFDESEALVTTITPSSSPGPYIAQADNIPSTSKFAIGGVAANAVAGIGAAGNFLGLIQDTCNESGFGDGKSLRVYEISYDKCDTNQITILADTTCGPMKIFVGKESNMNLAGMSSDQPYLNEQKRMIVSSSPITSDITEFSVVAKDKRDEFYQKINADQCSATKEYAFTTGYTSEQNSATQLLLPDWIKNNAKWWSNDEIDDQTFVSGIQYLVKNDIISVQKNIQTENTSDDVFDSIPDWIKNNAKWWSNDEIDDQTFVSGIQHLVKVGIIKVN